MCDEKLWMLIAFAKAGSTFHDGNNSADRPAGSPTRYRKFPM